MASWPPLATSLIASTCNPPRAERRAVSKALADLAAKGLIETQVLVISGQRRWARNFELAKYLNISEMTLWRRKNEDGYDSPGRQDQQHRVQRPG